MTSGQSAAAGPPAISPNGTPPHCGHMDGLVPAAAQSGSCRDCLAHEDRWMTLLACLTCGWVGCGDDSPNRHAKAHYEETDHPVARSLTPGSQSTWCHVHQRLV
jgi:uncharacterized UBP type Zn finger protein